MQQQEMAPALRVPTLESIGLVRPQKACKYFSFATVLTKGMWTALYPSQHMRNDATSDWVILGTPRLTLGSDQRGERVQRAITVAPSVNLHQTHVYWTRAQLSGH